MSTKPVIILTGASRGLGLAIAQHLLRTLSTRVLLVARTPGPLETLQSGFPDQVEFVVGDLGDLSVSRVVVQRAIEVFGRIDGVVVSHGVLDPVAKVADADVEAWRRCFDVGFFGAVELIKEAIGELRRSRGRVVFVSSGAAVTAYQGWGAYGASKAAMNNFSTTLAAEEPDVTSISIRPGVIDTQMQQEIREKHADAMGGSHGRFMQLKDTGKLLKPEQPGHVIAKLAVNGGRELSGQFLNWNAEQLAAFQE